MQTLQRVAKDVLTPHDICSVAHSLFDPVQFEVFETKWARLAAASVVQNAALGPQDPRRVVVADMLLSTGHYADVRGQVGFDPLVLDQCHMLGMAAIVRTLEMAVLKQLFATIVQGVDESFMKFAVRLTASVDRQADDPVTRRLVIANFARYNCNDDCKRVIEALPDDPTVSQMAETCVNITPLGRKLAAVATGVQPVWAVPQGRQPQQGNVQAGKKWGKKAQKVKFPMFLCGRCGWPNHVTNACKATAHVND
ncbi:uncharacterized protein LOC119695629 [Motacilla alba alba]|uniref:uncharacterized protein LOC119695629 n=1 Tax=Motacilla alba alba TaxID=1094192 RepID=UPI0018D564F4|nr:uncharacterized protein LOC119695629 [Motacilla alba alba]